MNERTTPPDVYGQLMSDVLRIRGKNPAGRGGEIQRSALAMLRGVEREGAPQAAERKGPAR